MELIPTQQPPLSRSETLLPFTNLDTISKIAFSPDSTLVFVASWDSTLTIYHLVPKYDPKRGQIGPVFEFMSSIVLLSPITTVLSLSNTYSLIGLVSGQIILIDTTILVQPKITIVYTCSGPVLELKYNQHHDIVIAIDFSSSLFVFHRLQFTTSPGILQRPLFSHVVPFLAQRINSNELTAQLRIPVDGNNTQNNNNNNNNNNNDPCTLSTLEPIQPHEVSPRYPVAMDTYHDFCIVALSRSLDVYQISITHPTTSTLDPTLAQTISLYTNLPSSLLPQTQSNNPRQSITTTTTTQPLSGTALSTYLRSISITLTKFASYHSPFVAQLTSLTFLPHTLSVTYSDENGNLTDHQPQITKIDDVLHPSLPTPRLNQTIVTKRIGFAMGSIEGRAGVDYVSISTLSTAQQRIMTREDDKRRFAFKCHRNTINDPQTSKPVDIIYSVNDVTAHPTAASFATCGGDGAIVIWSEGLKKRICTFGAKMLPIEHVAFSPNGQYIIWSESPVYNAMQGINVDNDHQNNNYNNRSSSTQFTQPPYNEKPFGFSNAENFTSQTLPMVLDSIESVELENCLFEEGDNTLLGPGLLGDTTTPPTQKGNNKKQTENITSQDHIITKFLNNITSPDQQYNQLRSFYTAKGFQPEQIDRWFNTKLIGQGAKEQLEEGGVIEKTTTTTKPSNPYRIFARVVSDQMVSVPKK